MKQTKRDEDRLTDEREQTICENFNSIILILEKCNRFDVCF